MYEIIKLSLEEGNILNDLTPLDKDILSRNSVVYVYFNTAKKNIYIGETSSFETRHSQHLQEKNPDHDYREYKQCIVIYSNLFNKSSVLDLEHKLINYMFAEAKLNKFTFMNKNSGQSNLSYKDSFEIYEKVFIPLWTQDFIEMGLALSENIKELQESLLFKYSPFKSLSSQQKEIVDNIVENPNEKYLVNAPAGSGKSVLFTSLAFKLAESYPNMSIGLITTGNLKNQFNNIFKAVGLKNRLEVLTAAQVLTRNKKYDIIIVDEAHKLKRYYTKGHPNARRHLEEGDNEMSKLECFTQGLVFLYDEYQGIRPQNIEKDTITELTKNYIIFELIEQFRIKGDEKINGEEYLKAIKYALQLSENSEFNSNILNSNYLEIMDTFSDVVKYVTKRNHAYPETTNRVLAGYTKDWISKKDNNDFDWNVDDIKMKWNSSYEDWVMKESSSQEMGSIHSIQGYDLNYAGVIIGDDITVIDGTYVAVPENYKDIGGTPLKKDFKIDELTQYILNIYYVLLSRGIDGCAIYFEDEKVKNLFLKRLSKVDTLTGDKKVE